MVEPAPFPDDERGGLQRFLILTTCIALGAALAFGAMPYVYDAADHELVRSRNLFEALTTDESKGLDLVVLGNSIVMNGIDTQVLEDEVSGVDKAWNLASTAQGMLEAALIINEVPPSVQEYVFGLTYTELTKSTHQLSSSKYTAYYMYGYRPTPHSVWVANTAAGEKGAGLFGAGRFRSTIASRWIVTSYIDTAVRTLLRDDLEIDRAMIDLHRPAPYTQQVSASVLEGQLRDMPDRSPADAVVSDASWELLAYLSDHVRERGAHMTLVILPEHPERLTRTDSGYIGRMETQLSDWARPRGIDVLFEQNLVPTEYFIDSQHTDSLGARLLTQALADHLLAR